MARVCTKAPEVAVSRMLLFPTVAEDEALMLRVTAELLPLERLTADGDGQTLSYEVVKLADWFTRGEHFLHRNHFLPIAFQAKILDHLSKVKGKLNSCAVATNMLRSIELRIARNVCRNTGLAPAVANVVCAKLEEANIPGRGIGSRCYTAE